MNKQESHFWFSSASYGCHFSRGSVAEISSNLTYCVWIVVSATLLLWQPRAKKGRWKLFTAHAALTSLLYNPPAGVPMQSLSGSNSGRVDLNGPRLQSLMIHIPEFFQNHHFVDVSVVIWLTASLSITLTICAHCYWLSGNVMQTRYNWTSQHPLCPVSTKAPLLSDIARLTL